jgi:hypothetical protein
VLILVDEQYRARHAAEEFFFVATRDQPLKPLMRVSGNHKHVDPQVLRCLDDFFAGYSDAELGPAIAVSLADLFSEGLESVLGMVEMSLYRRISGRTAQIGYVVRFSVNV